MRQTRGDTGRVREQRCRKMLPGLYSTQSWPKFPRRRRGGAERLIVATAMSAAKWRGCARSRQLVARRNVLDSARNRESVRVNLSAIRWFLQQRVLVGLNQNSSSSRGSRFDAVSLRWPEAGKERSRCEKPIDGRRGARRFRRMIPHLPATLFPGIAAFRHLTESLPCQEIRAGSR